LGECKWGTDKVAREVVSELVEKKAPLLLQALPEAGRGWSVHYAFFSRAGFTPAAQTLARAQQAILVDLARLDRELGG
jgi:hypothetical protein